MPIPSTRHTAIVSTSDRKRLFAPTSSTKPAKFDAAPVSVSTPMMTPTIAQAMPTATACLAPSIRLPRMIASVSRPPWMTRLTRHQRGDHRDDRPDAELEEARRAPARARSRTRSGTAIEPKPEAMPTPRMSTAVSASPTIPENIGVKPSNSMNTSTASGSIRYHLTRIACHGFGHSAFGSPMQACAAGLEVHHPERGHVVEESPGSRRP